MSDIRIQVDGLDRLDRVIDAISEQGTKIPRELLRVLRDVAENLAREASGKVLAEPTHGDKHTGLRLKVSEGVKVQDIDHGVRIVTEMPKSDEAVIPRGFDTRVGGHWRHPLFGNRSKWYENYGGFSWFMDTMQDGQQPVEDGLTRVLEDAADAIARA